jgi:hypothetical protein
MLAAAADATATPAPGRLHRFTNGFSRRPFRYPAHAAGVAGYRKFFVPSNRCWLADGFRRGVRREKVSGLLTRHFVPRGGERSLSLAVAILVAEAARLRHGQDTKHYHAQAGGLGVPDKLASAARTPAVTERTLALVPRAKYPHCSARARDGLISLPPLHSLTHLLHRFRRSLSLIPKSSKLTRPSMQTAGAPKK